VVTSPPPPVVDSEQPGQPKYVQLANRRHLHAALSLLTHEAHCRTHREDASARRWIAA
jgi:hypothetical protein